MESERSVVGAVLPLPLKTAKDGGLHVKLWFLRGLPDARPHVFELPCQARLKTRDEEKAAKGLEERKTECGMAGHRNTVQRLPPKMRKG